MGLDDFLVARGADSQRELRALLDSAEEPVPPGSVDMRRHAKEIDATREGPACLDETKRDGVYRLRYHRDSWWWWRHGAYREKLPSEVRAVVAKFLMKDFYGLGISHISNVVEIAKAVAHLDYSIDAPAWLDKPTAPWPATEILVARNSLIHLPTLVAGLPDYRRAATPLLFSLSALDYNFATDAAQPVAWLTFLDQLWPDDVESIAALQEWFGYCLTSDTSQQKILMAVGPKRSGKGTIARILRHTVGKENVCGPTLASLSGNFGLQPLLGKSLAIISDARLGGKTDSSVVVERLLSISGEDALTVDRKFQEPVTGKLPTRIMLLSNELPRLGDSSGALAGRMILLRLTQSFYGQEDHKLTDKLMAELPGVLLWAIEGWRRLNDRGRFVQPSAAAELLGELNDLTSPVAAFLRECCNIGPEYEVQRTALYESYAAWAKEHGRQERYVEDETGFGRNLRAALPILRTVKHRLDGQPVRFYGGVGLK